VGLNAGVFPRTARADPFLSDPTRERLRDSTGKAVPVRSEGIDEEHLLATLLLGAARERLDISWQRADAAGATRSPSLFLREVARAVLGAADLDELLRSAAALPSHPGERLERVTREPGLLSPEENVLLSAFRARGDPNRVARLAELDPTLGPGLRMLTATESFAPGDLGFDGRIADAVPRPGALSVSAFGRLGECPLKFFFRDVLDVRELKEPASLFEVDKTDLGNRVHALLDALYRRLHREGLFVTGRAADLVDRAECWLEQAWTDAFAVMDARWRRRAPLLAESLMGKWLTSLRGFLREDLARLTAEGWTDPDFEASRAVNLDVHPETIRLEGRLDREFRQGERRLIGDYKTGEITGLADPARMLKGASLQVPLYRLLAGGSPTVEVLGVGPMHDPVQGEPAERRVVFEGFAAGELDEGFRETARVLLDLVFRGRFPLRADDHCAWCPYARACRHRHPPTLERERNAKDASDFVDLAGKSTKKPTLETVRAGGNALDAVEE
jgi:RecB family exonuclease